MQCSVTLESNRNSGKVKMKTINHYKNYKKETNFDNIVDQLCTKLQDIEDQESESRVGMPTCSIDQTEAVRRYYAAFPALKKGQESPLQYYLPPPAWCRKKTPQTDNMQSEVTRIQDWNIKSKKLCSGKERRNSYHGQRRNKRRYNSFSRSFESKESLPEWVTYEGVWDMETQDPVKEFIRAIALDEGYGTCENTLTDDIRAVRVHHENSVPDWDDGLDLDTEWVITEDLTPRIRTPMEEELYAKFEAKFDRSIEALWEQNTPDDEYQELPIDFHDLLSSPSDRLFNEKCVPLGSADVGSEEVLALPDRLRPLNLADPPELDSLALYEGDEIYEALAAVAGTMRSFTAINHSRDTSGFVEVPPRRARNPITPAAPAIVAVPPLVDENREDLLTSSRTHFRPIRRDSESDTARYADGDTFDIRGDLDPVVMRRSESGGLYVGDDGDRYLEYQRLRFPMRQKNAAVQTETAAACDECGRAAKKMRADPVWAACEACTPRTNAPPPAYHDTQREWDELMSDISAAHAQYAAEPHVVECEARADRKRRHSAALKCTPVCSHPHARFLPACAAHHRPLTR